MAAAAAAANATADVAPTTSTLWPPHELPLPRSKIYVTADPPASAAHTRFKTPISASHFLLVLQCGHLYTAEDLADAQGRYRCYNCSRPIHGPIYLLPERFNPQTNEPTCRPIPHCRTSCVYRTVQDLPNNGDLLTNLFLMYGHDMVCAPPRFLLYVPGGFTLDQYHEAIDQRRTYETNDPLIHVFVAPLLVSCTIQHDHQLLPEAVDYIDALRATKKATIGPLKKSGTPEQVVVPLAPKRLTETPLSAVFQPDPASFGRPALAHNPHMGDAATAP